MSNGLYITREEFEDFKRRVIRTTRGISAVVETISDPEVTVYKRKTVLTDAQIKSLPTSPVEVMPAPGVGKITMVHGAICVAVLNGAGAYISDAGANTAWQLDSTGAYISSHLVVNDMITNGGIGYITTPLTVTTSGNANTVMSGYVEYMENTAINLRDRVSADDYLGGHPDNRLEVTVFYSIIDL